MPQAEGSCWRKIFFVLLVVVIIVPLVWLPCGILAGFACNKFLLASGYTRFVHYGEALLPWLPLPVVVAVVFGVARRGLTRGWHRRPLLLRRLGIAATCIMVFVVFLVQSMIMDSRSSRFKALLTNLRQLAAATDQYCLENGVTSVAFSQLVGPTSYVKALNTVAGEQYPVRFTQGVTITITGYAGARTITYAP